MQRPVFSLLYISPDWCSSRFNRESISAPITTCTCFVSVACLEFSKVSETGYESRKKEKGAKAHRSHMNVESSIFLWIESDKFWLHERWSWSDISVPPLVIGIIATEWWRWPCQLLFEDVAFVQPRSSSAVLVRARRVSEWERGSTNSKTKLDRSNHLLPAKLSNSIVASASLLTDSSS